jgi:hypothetical protein
MEAESDSSESDHPIASTKNKVTEDILMDIDEDNSQLMDMDEDYPLLDPNPINEREVKPNLPRLESIRPVTIEEEVEDDEEYRWIENYPEPAATTHGQDSSKFESLRKDQIAEGSAPWYPFESEEEWELGRWLMTSGISHKQIDSFLKLHKVGTSPQFKQSLTRMSSDTRRC